MLRKDFQSYVCLKDRPPGLWSQVEKSKNFCMEFLSDNDKIVIENGYCLNPETTIGIIFGEPCAPYDSERVQAIEALFADTGLHYRSTEYIREEMWSKFRLNVCNNLPQAILGAGVGCYQDSVHMKAISDGLRRELEAIAAAKGIVISKAAASSGHGSAVPPSAR